MSTTARRALLPLVLLAMLVPGEGSAAPEKITYVTNEGSHISVHSLGTPAGDVAWHGQLWMTARVRRLAILIEDAGAQAGEVIPVVAWDDSTKRQLLGGCVPVGTKIILRGATAGGRVYLNIGEDPLRNGPLGGLGCARATAGTLTLWGASLETYRSG